VSPQTIGLCETLTVKWQLANAVRCYLAASGPTHPLDMSADGTVTCYLRSYDGYVVALFQARIRRGAANR
jgi:hypothetical protein